MTYQHRKRQIAVLDIETDPFVHGRPPQAFACGFMTEDEYTETWGDDCIAEMMAELVARRQAYVIYAHNGGRFDFHYLYPWLENPIKVINGSIVKAAMGRHQLRDSFSILPMPLAAAGGKKIIDYRLFEKARREKHKRKIRRYLEADCEALLQLVTRFERDFGRQLTVGQTAIKQLQAIMPVPHLTASGDEYFRPYYFGGRVQCFRHGDIRAKGHKRYVVLDRNSMYPAVMKDFQHPWGGEYDDQSSLPDDDDPKPYFAEIEATSKGALPRRAEDGTVDFPHGRGRFLVCSHELRAARRLGLVEVHGVEYCKVAQQTVNFAAYVDHFWRMRQVYREAGDLHGELFCKFMLNALYGKFGANPEKYKEWMIAREGEWSDEDLAAEGWGMEEDEDGFLVGPEPYSTCPAFALYARPARRRWYYDVGVAASITSAARACLLQAISGADDPLYTDTDSLICRAAAVPLGKGLGEWKVEARCDRVVIAGKKLYALQWRGKWLKVRAKGGRLTGAQMVKIARGGIVEYNQDAPTFGLSLVPKFNKRQFEMTIDEDGD